MRFFRAAGKGRRRSRVCPESGPLWLGLVLAGMALGATSATPPRPRPYFERNGGQAAPAVSYLSRASGYSLALENTGSAVYAIPGADVGGLEYVRMEIVGAAPGEVTGEGRLSSVSNWYGSTDPDRWLAGLPNFSSVAFRRILPGVDLLWRSVDGDLEYQFALAPGADPGRIRLRFEGAQQIRIEETGDLLVGAGSGVLRFRRPYAYQEAGGARTGVPAWFALEGGTVRFELAGYDAALGLVIDPTLRFLSFAGGAGFDAVYAVGADAAGNLYFAGETASADFPGAAKTTRANRDAFVTKVSADGSRVLYTTILAGAGNDSVRALAVTGAGTPCIAGVTTSANFPVKSALYPTAGGVEDAFAGCLDAQGRLSWATFLGGGGSDVATGVGLDSAGNVYVAGFTSSTTFPTTAAAPQRTYRGGFYDAFVSELAATGSSLIASTLLGGSGGDQANGLAVEASGRACIAGRTDSANLPVTSGAYQAVRGGGGDAFVACLSPAGTSWSSVTSLGGGGEDVAYAVALDAAGSAYVAGATYSQNFPVTSGAWQAARHGDYDAFVAKLDSSGKTLVYSTLIGGAGLDSATAIAVDNAGAAWAAGFTSSADFPTQSAWQGAYAGGFDAFAVQLKPDGAGLLVSSYLGGAGDDRAMAVALRSGGEVVLGGYSGSANLAATSGAIQTAATAGYNGFLAVVGANQAPSVTRIAPASGSGVAQNFTVTVADPDGAGDIDQVIVMVAGALNGPGSCSLNFRVSKNQVMLIDDAGSAWMPQTLTAGASGTLANSQCALNASGFSSSGAGATLSAVVSVAFRPAFAGSKTVYVYVIDRYGGVSGWQTSGTWTVPGGNQPPAAVALSPNMGSGISQNFTVAASDANGYGDIDQMVVMFNTGVNGAASCSLNYWFSKNAVYLINDAGNGWLSQTVQAGVGSPANSQCTLNGAGFSFSGSGTTLTATISVTFQGAFAGVKNVYVLAIDRSGAGSGYQAAGTWTVAVANQPPSADAVGPGSGSGVSQVFRVTASDPNGYSDVDQLIVMISPNLNGAAACSLDYKVSRNTVQLINDSGSAWLSGTLTGGVTGTLANSQCTLEGSGFSFSGAGNTLTANVPVTFKGGFAGAKVVYLLAIDRTGSGSGWRPLGAWTVP